MTRLESPDTGIVIEGRFELGWIGRLTPEQLHFAELLIRHRGNVQKVAAELNMAYNTARSRLDEIVAAIKPRPSEQQRRESAAEILDRLDTGEIDIDKALHLLKERS